MRRLIERLLARFGFVRAVEAPRYTVEEMTFAFGQREAAARWESYHIGFAQGELSGRLALCGELAVQFGIDGGEQKFERDDILRIVARQIH